jgi:hypothetical protein
MQCGTSAKNTFVRGEWLRQSGRAPSEPSETPWRRITPCPASVLRFVLYSTLRSPFRRFFSFCRSPIHSGVVASCDHTSEWVHWVHACIGIAMCDAAKTSAHFPSTFSSRSVGRDTHNSVDPWNLGKSEWEQKLGKIECVLSLDDKMRWKWDAVYLPWGLPNVYSASLIPPPLSLYLRTPTVAP